MSFYFAYNNCGLLPLFGVGGSWDNESTGAMDIFDLLTERGARVHTHILLPDESFGHNLEIRLKTTPTLALSLDAFGNGLIHSLRADSSSTEEDFSAIRIACGSHPQDCRRCCAARRRQQKTMHSCTAGTRPLAESHVLEGISGV